MRRAYQVATSSRTRAWQLLPVIAAACAITAVQPDARAQAIATDTTQTAAPPIGSLKGLTPQLPDLSDYIDPADPEALKAARQLGKALFWDTQAGTDRNACASCHFHAGADIRTQNQVNPGRLDRTNKPNQQLTPSAFPLHKLLDPADRESRVLSDSDDIISSQGAFTGDFVSSLRGSTQGAVAAAIGFSNGTCNLAYTPLDILDPAKGSPFHANGRIYRRVESRHTPSVINAAFNVRQYWDGRANNQFNGVDPFGPRTYVNQMVDPAIDPNYVFGNPNAPFTGLIAASNPLGAPAAYSLVQPLIENASLASQAVGPQLSSFESLCGQKSFADIGRRLLPMTPLATQVVDPNDSLFSQTQGLVKQAAIPGLNTTYKTLIQKAFRDKWWAAEGPFVIDPLTKQPKQATAGYSQMEYNFSLFWGLAIQAYEQLLISDDTPFDRYMNGNATAISAAAIRGKDLFNGKGNCAQCHSGPLLTQAATTSTAQRPKPAVESMLMRDGYPALNDAGFYNTGVRPTSEDLGAGALDVYGFDLSFTRQYRWQIAFGAKTSSSIDLFQVTPCTAQSPTNSGCLTIPNIPRDAVDGAFKTPSLRNVGLTPPYFHTGGQSNLKDVVAFYNRGGDRRTTPKGDTTGLDAKTPLEEINQTNLAANIGEPLGSTRRGLDLTDQEMNDLVEFLLTLTDNRVACHSDVFDHPELPLVIGQRDTAQPGTPLARDIIATLPATGKFGLKATSGECFPNTGDLFATLNKDDRRPLQPTLQRILKRLDISN